MDETTVHRPRKRSPSPSPRTHATSPQSKRKRKTAQDEVAMVPGSVRRQHQGPLPPHARDKVDFAARLTTAAPESSRKVFRTRVRCCESLYDALASGIRARES